MSILIRNMEMPENCDKCRFQSEFRFCDAMPDNFCERTDDIERPDWCPLVEVRRGMNHDYAHCADYTADCPKDCFRAELTEDLKHRSDLLGLPFTWMHFRGTEECKRKEEE